MLENTNKDTQQKQLILLPAGIYYSDKAAFSYLRTYEGVTTCDVWDVYSGTENANVTGSGTYEYHFQPNFNISLTAWYYAGTHELGSDTAVIECTYSGGKIIVTNANGEKETYSKDSSRAEPDPIIIEDR